MRPALVALLVVLLSPPVLASDLSEAIDSLRSGTGDRIQALEALESPAKAEKKERKQLAKALRKLDEYSGEDDSRGLKQCGKIVKLIQRSKSEDQDILSAVGAVRVALETLAHRIRVFPDSMIDMLGRDFSRGPKKSVDRGGTAMAAARDTWPDNPRKCIVKLGQAIGHYRKAIRMAEQIFVYLYPLKDLYDHGARLYNKSDREFRITDITYAVDGTLAGEPYSYGGKASESHPHLLPITIESMSTYDYKEITSTLCESDPDYPENPTGVSLTWTCTIHTTGGNFSFVLP